jgi:hypothetical protein
MDIPKSDSSGAGIVTTLSQLGMNSTGYEFRELMGDGLRRFALARSVRESLQDNLIRLPSDWGSSGRRFKSCQPDQRNMA